MEKTQSDELFERFCTDNGFRFSRIETETDRKTPDYEVFPRDNRVIVEVKEFTPNAEDGRLRNERKPGGSNSAWINPSSRIRQKIATAAPQLKSRSNGLYPAILVLFDNTTFREIDDWTDIKTAMYGDETFDGLDSADVMYGNCRLGGNRKCTATDNTSLSAVCLLELQRDVPYLSIFHNVFSKCPLPPEWFRVNAVQQFSIDLNSDVDCGWPGWHGV